MAVVPLRHSSHQRQIGFFRLAESDLPKRLGRLPHGSVLTPVLRIETVGRRHIQIINTLKRLLEASSRGASAALRLSLDFRRDNARHNRDPNDYSIFGHGFSSFIAW